MTKCNYDTNTQEIYGYVRVSSTDQNEDRQMLEMQRLKIKKKNIGKQAFKPYKFKK